jgi:5'-nucleotidase
MRALITNDDGIDAQGLRVLARAAVEAGLDVVVAAPHIERSGFGTGLTSMEAFGKLLLTERELEGLPRVRALAVEASPSMIALIGVRAGFGFAPDVVLSGINHGPNTGQFLIHSGTAGAAFTAVNQGVPGLALSFNNRLAQNWDTAAEVARRSIDWFMAHLTTDAIVNVNIPDVPMTEFKGFRSATLARQGAVSADVVTFGEGHVTMTFRRDEGELLPDSDSVLMRQGFATVTAVGNPAPVLSVDLSGIASA